MDIWVHDNEPHCLNLDVNSESQLTIPFTFHREGINILSLNHKLLNSKSNEY